MLRIRLEGLVATVIALALFTIAAPAHAAIIRGWTQGNDMSIPRSDQSAVLLDNGKVLVAGGVTTGGRTNKAELFDPVSGTWSPASPMIDARSNFALIKLPDGEVLAAGGFNDTAGALDRAEIYNPTSNAWRSVDRMTVPRNRPTASLLPNGKVLVAGGVAGDSPYSTFPSANGDVFDPTTQRFSTTGTFPNGRADASSVPLNLPNGWMLVTGGNGGNAGGPRADAAIYAPATNGWISATAMNTQRANFGLVALNNGKVLAAGGSNANQRPPFTQIYDPRSNTWSTSGPMLNPHDTGTFTLLNSGQVLAVAGLDSTGVAASTELYDPTADAWVTAGRLNTARYSQTATLLGDGRVLVTGGRLVAPLSSVEIYTPTTAETHDPAVTFADTTVGSTVTANIGISNSGAPQLLVGDFAFTGANPGDFSVVTNGCAVVAPGASCAVTVRFAPGAVALRTATLKYSDNANGIEAVALTGRGTTVVGPPVQPPLTPKLNVNIKFLSKWTSKATWFQKLQVTGAPKGSTITVTCPKGCPRTHYVKRTTKPTTSILSIVSKRHIRVGRSITVVVAHPGYVTAVKMIKIRKKGGPLVAPTRCLPPEATKSVACATLP